MSVTAPATPPIPLVDLAAQYRALRPEIDAAIQRVVEQGDFVLGGAVAEFERVFADFCGVAYGVGVASGTDALWLGLKALGVGPGDEVIVPAFTFAATAEVVVHCGARPVFVDVRPDDLLLDPGEVEAAVTPRTRGIIPVHLYGRVADMAALANLAARKGLWLLEDAAQAHGASREGRTAGSAGVAGAFSFYPGKNLGAYGDGGMLVTDDRDLAERVRALRHHGQARRYEHDLVGFCSRLDTLQAAVLLAKLPHLADWNAARRAAVERYDALLEGRFERIHSADEAGAVHHLYVVRVPDGRRDALLARLQARGVGAGVHYPHPLHRLAAFAPYSEGVSLPVAEQAAAEVLSLPLFPEISEEQQARVARELLAA